MTESNALKKQGSIISANDYLGHQPKYRLSKFHTDHQSRSTIQLLPALPQPSRVALISPFDPTLEIMVRQQIFFEVGRRHTFGLAFDASRVATSSYRQVHVSHEYQNMHKHKIKTTVGFGSNWYLAWEAHQKLKSGIIVSVYTSCLKNFRDRLLMGGVGFKQGNLEVVAKVRNQADPLLSITYGLKQFRNSLSISMYLELGDFTESLNSNLKVLPVREAELQLWYPLTDYRATLTANLLKLDSVKIGFEKKTRYGMVGLATEYFSSGQTVVSIGINKKNFRLSLPILVIDSVVPTVIFGLIYFLGVAFRKKKPIEEPLKTELDRMNEIRLIEDKANENYQKERQKNGLIIKYAYYGDSEQISRIDNPVALPPSIVDVTVPLRFFVEDSKLYIKANNRESVYGFYRVNDKAINYTLVVYEPKGRPGVTQRAMFKDSEPIIL